MAPETALEPRAPPLQPLLSKHTSNFPALLEQLGISILVSTYQAGKLVILRSDGTAAVNTHFRDFQRPMGLAADRTRLALGTAQELRLFRNMPPVRVGAAPSSTCCPPSSKTICTRAPSSRGPTRWERTLAPVSLTTAPPSLTIA